MLICSRFVLIFLMLFLMRQKAIGAMMGGLGLFRMFDGARLIIASIVLFSCLGGHEMMAEENEFISEKSSLVQQIQEVVKCTEDRCNDKRVQKFVEGRERTIKALAESGESNAQFLCGKMNEHGWEVEKNIENAVKWYKISAKQGNASAQYCLGVTIYNLQKNPNQAKKWFEKSAEQGNADAQVAIGAMYALGIGVQQDFSEAAKWIQKSAKQGNAMGQYRLGLLYSHGSGVKKDLERGRALLEKAARSSDKVVSEAANRALADPEMNHVRKGVSPAY